MFAGYRTRTSRLVGVLVAILLAAGLAACGSEDDSAGAGDKAKADKAKAVEKAFLTGMVHHHESAIEMAEIAEKRADDPFIKKLAGDIVSTQAREIVQMEEFHERLLGRELKPDPGAHDGLGLTAEEAGMTHSSATTEMLRSANPIDRAFVDEMVPHHEGAVKMSNVVLKSTRDAPLRKLAERIISTQEREIEEMNAFRTKKFGGPVPEGAAHGTGSEGKEPAGENGHGAGHSR